MKKTFLKKFKKLFLWLIAIFVILFAFRFIYGYTETFESSPSQTNFFNNIKSVQRNYASKKYSVKSESPNRPSINVDQKYEKIADVVTKSSDFENEEKVSREKIKKYNALIQFEQKNGNEGYRTLNLLIGVPPKNFDLLYKELIKIGKIQAKQITKKDKTNEYKELNAKRQSLEKIRSSLIELKTKGGKISEYVQLENRILEIEKQLQELGVSLGDFDDENEFCTVKFSLLEGKEITIGILHRIKVAFEWTVEMYMLIIVILFFISLFVYFVLLIVDKLKIFEALINKKE